MKVDWGFITAVLAVLTVVLLVWSMEKNNLDSRQLSLIAALTALGAAGRAAAGIGLLFLQPTMFLPLITGLVMGGKIGFFVGAMIPLVSNFFMGQGPWTPYQMLAWGLIGTSGAIIKRFFPGVRSVHLTIICAGWGYLYGAIMELWQWLSFVQPLTVKGYIALWAAGLPFDSLRALGNFFFCGLLGAHTIKILTFYKKKLCIQYIKEWNLAESPAIRHER